MPGVRGRFQRHGIRPTQMSARPLLETAKSISRAVSTTASSCGRSAPAQTSPRPCSRASCRQEFWGRPRRSRWRPEDFDCCRTFTASRTRARRSCC
jgi:hypothetical protein